MGVSSTSAGGAGVEYFSGHAAEKQADYDVANFFVVEVVHGEVCRKNHPKELP